jgi:hypothetical protein
METLFLFLEWLSAVGVQGLRELYIFIGMGFALTTIAAYLILRANDD